MATLLSYLLENLFGPNFPSEVVDSQVNGCCYSKQAKLRVSKQIAENVIVESEFLEKTAQSDCGQVKRKKTIEDWDYPTLQLSWAWH
jgi:hypothetical protein